MTPRWQLRGFSVVTEHGTLSDVDASFSEARVCLLGTWEPLFRLLAGRAPRHTGALLFDGEPAREAVIRGQLGLAGPTLRLPSDATVQAWLTDNLRLLGHSKRVAKAGADRSLGALQVGFLSGRPGRSLSAAEVYAARLALALSTQPRSILAPAPTNTDPTLSFQWGLLQRIAERAQLVLVSDWFTDAGAIGWSQRILSVDKGRLVSDCATQRWLRERSCYCLVTKTNQKELEAELANIGAEIHNPGQRELLVSLPRGSSTRPLVGAAHRAQAPLIRMLPLEGQAADASAQVG